MKIKIALFSLVALFVIASVRADGEVVASIKPIQSIAQAVMGETGKVALTQQGDISPHAHMLKPSQIKKLQQARAILYIGAEFETSLASALRSASGRLVALADSPGLLILPRRKMSGEEHPHEQREEDEHGHNDHGHEEEHDHETEHQHHGYDDLHIWLDPENAKKMAFHIANELAAVYPENAAVYAANAEDLAARLDALDAELSRILAETQNRPYIVFHDAYQYFERRYGLLNVGSVGAHSNVSPSARRLSALRDKIEADSVRCVFHEPQFSARTVDVLVADGEVKRAILDPLGADLPEGEGMYFQLMRHLATTLRDCLS